MIIAIERTDGGVSIMNFADGISVDKELDKWKLVYPNLYKSHGEIDALPADRDDRGRWKIVNGKVTKSTTPKVETTKAQKLAQQIADDPIALATLTAAINKGVKK